MLFSLLLSLFVLIVSSEPSFAEEINLDVNTYESIFFEGIKKTEYFNEGKSLVAKVSSSSSVLMKAYAKVLKIRGVRIEWQSKGAMNIKSHDQERTKKGDDARFRIGLILSGDAPYLPFFAPAWIKKISSILKLPSDRMLYLNLGSLAKPGQRWSSPYSDSIESIALAKKRLDDDWYESKIIFKQEKKIVGFWLFADGDDSNSQFITKVRNLSFTK